MKLSDYIAQFLVRKGITDIFGYQGTMIAHLYDSLSGTEGIRVHSSYHEQAAAFAACGYAQAKGDCAAAFATSGPGAANLLSGIADAYFDSLPVIFFTGQLNTYEYSGIPGLRQQGFQEIDIVSMAKPVTKYAVQVSDPSRICRELCLAYAAAMDGRRGPVLIDLPMDVQRAQIDRPVFEMTFSEEEIRSLEENGSKASDGIRPAAGKAEGQIHNGRTGHTAAENPVREAVDTILQSQRESGRPLLLVGRGVNAASVRILKQMAEGLDIPIVSSVPACSFFDWDDPYYFGCLGGAYGHRCANLLAGKKSDLLICLGISLCTRQIGTKVHEFAKDAAVIRVDIDAANLQRQIHEGKNREYCFQADVHEVVDALWTALQEAKIRTWPEWLAFARKARRELDQVDAQGEGRMPNRLISWLSDQMTGISAVGVDVGQHMVWTYQSFHHTKDQKLLFSGGHGAMGYGLPAAIGAWYATGRPVACICGDGAFQMNIQELQWVVREQIPIRILVMNNRSLGMIYHLQRDYFEDRYYGTAPEGGFTSGNFARIAHSYGLAAMRADGAALLPEGEGDSDTSALREKVSEFLRSDGPALLEICLEPGTYAYPKTCLGEPIYNQQPYIPKRLYEELVDERQDGK